MRGERCCFVIVLSVIYFIFWGYVSGFVSSMFSEPKCFIPDEDMEKLVQNEIAEHYPEVQKYLDTMTNKSKEAKFCPWPPLEFEGRKPIDKVIYNWKEMEAKYSFIESGHYKPTNCTPHQNVAILVFVYKEVGSEKQFQIFLNNVVPKLRRQQLEFSIYVVRQQANDIANRGLLFNIGFKQAMKDRNYDCVILHDVDVLPEDDRNYYDCGIYPRHMSKRIDINNYKPFDRDWCGGIISMTTEQYKKMNGWSNMYFGKRRDNADVFRRIVTHYDLIRTEDKYSYCGTTTDTALDQQKRERCWIFEATARTWQLDGLSSTRYRKLQRKKTKLFTIFEIDVFAKEIREDYINRTRRMVNYDKLPNATLTLNNLFCEQLLGRKLNMNAKLVA